MDLKCLRLRMSDVPGVDTPTGTVIKIPVHPEVTGTPQTAPMSFLYVEIPPGNRTSLHAHENCIEYDYVLSGTKGLLQVGEEKDIPIEHDMMVINLRGVKHCFQNTGNDTMRLLRLHVPALEPVQPGDEMEQAIGKAKRAFDHTKGAFKTQ